jgi:hypothetical protein
MDPTASGSLLAEPSGDEEGYLLPNDTIPR